MFCGMCEWQKHAICHYFIYNWACYLYWKHPATIDVLIQIRAIFEIDLKTWVHSQIAKYGWNNIERPSAVESTLRFQPILILIRIMVETSTLIQCRKQRHCACILPFRWPLNQRWNFQRWKTITFLCAFCTISTSWPMVIQRCFNHTLLSGKSIVFNSLL